MKYRLTPYMFPDELEYLENTVLNLHEKARIAEWGSGGSTTMFVELMKPKQHMISVEHDPEWAVKVTQALEDHENRDNLLAINVHLQNIELRAEDGSVNREAYELYKKHMIGSYLEENPSFLEHYIDPSKLIKITDEKTDSEIVEKIKTIYDSDLFFVDGLARGACLATIRTKATNKDAVVFIHDYIGRQNQYDWAVSLYSKKELVGKTLLKLTI